MTRERIVFWTLYNNPRDFPGFIVARGWIVGDGIEPYPMRFACLYDTIELARDHMRALGLSRIVASASDDPVIIESWL